MLSIPENKRLVRSFAEILQLFQNTESNTNPPLLHLALEHNEALERNNIFVYQ